MAKRILVTGADGFIGSHLTEALVRDGHSVRAFTLYNSLGHRGWLDASPTDIQQSIEFFAGDIRDPHGVQTAMKDIDVVYHLAALIAIPYSYHSPSTYIDTNITGTLNVVQAARNQGVDKVVHTSTSEVYGTARYVPIDEEHPLQGQSPYSASKIGADQIALAFHKSFGTPVAIIRPFNTYGPRQSARAVIPTIITQLLGGKQNIMLGALGPTRDFNFVADTVRGFKAVAANAASIGDVINIGSNFEISIGDTAELIAEVMGRSIVIESEERRFRPADSEVERLWADNSKAREVLGWEPEYGGRAGFKRGLEETVAWFAGSSDLGGYRPNEYAI